MPIKLNSPGGGSVTIDVPNMSTANTLTLPAITGNVITSADSNTVTQSMINRAGFYGGFGPAFSAYNNAAQSIPNVTWTKINCNVEEFDTASCYDNSTNYRFTPTIAGYYQISAETSLAASAGTQLTTIYKNGAEFKRGTRIGNPLGNLGTSASALVYLNGTTDFVEVYVYQDSGSSTTINVSGTAMNYFQGFLARPA
jgi:hypothetical protein